jgi:hypothetical protein
MFEFRLRILDARESDTAPNSLLGIVEGFPEILVHATSVAQAEVELTSAVVEHFKRLRDHEATRLEPDEYPTVHASRLYLVGKG